MKFMYIREVEGEVNTYDGKTVKTGDIVEFEGIFAEKAMNHPDYEIVQEDDSLQDKPRRGRPRNKITPVVIPETSEEPENGNEG